jgi:hypothetical protein
MSRLLMARNIEDGNGRAGACTVRKLGSAAVAAGAGGTSLKPLPLPLPASVQPGGGGGGGGGYVVYGAEWCIYCQRTAHLLAELGIPEAHVDVRSDLAIGSPCLGVCTHRDPIAAAWRWGWAGVGWGGWLWPGVRVRVEIIGPGKYENVRKSQSVLMMIDPILFFTRTRVVW